jgi:phage baseplate assembly protein W
MPVGSAGAIQAPPPSAGVYGQGVKYPPTLDTSTGRLALSWGTKLVDESILSICRTVPKERVMLPGYGAATVTFEPIDEYKMREALTANIAEYEPRATNVEVDVKSEANGVMVAHISYVPVGEANTRTLTYPIFTPPSGSL